MNYVLMNYVLLFPLICGMGVLLTIFYLDIFNEATVRISYYILLLVTIIGYIRLCPKNLYFNLKLKQIKYFL
jgi:hypothetical protein